eukprot:1222870-Prorocentrum_lima.AAC.1
MLALFAAAFRCGQLGVAHRRSAAGLWGQVPFWRPRRLIRRCCLRHHRWFTNGWLLLLAGGRRAPYMEVAFLRFCREPLLG